MRELAEFLFQFGGFCGGLAAVGLLFGYLAAGLQSAEIRKFKKEEVVGVEKFIIINIVLSVILFVLAFFSYLLSLIF
jgi:hypothetical protein